MIPDEIGKTFSDAADRALPAGADDAAMRRTEAAILGDLRPVRPTAAAWIWVLILVALFAGFAGASAAFLGILGFGALSPIERVLIFTALFGSAWLAASACVRAMIPAAGSRLDGAAFAVGVVGFPLLFALIFRNYSTQDLVSEGLPCLKAGLSVALPASIAVAWILRRGFVLKWSTAGLAAGVLSGLAGLGMLELHCANRKAIHVILWHVAVVLVSGICGFACGRIADAFPPKRR